MTELWVALRFCFYEIILSHLCATGERKFPLSASCVIMTELKIKLMIKWKNNGNSICLGSKITSDGNCSHEIKRRLLLGRKAMTNLDSILQSRHITLWTKVCLIKAMVLPVVMYGCESWTTKKAEHWRIDAFVLCAGEVAWESLGLQGDQISQS